MRRQGLLWLNAICSLFPATLLASAIVEGRVELPKSHSAPVQAKRYFQRSCRYSSGPRLNSQIWMTLITTFFPTRLPNVLILGVIGQMSDRSRRKFSISRAWSYFGATFTNTCVD